MLKTEVDKLDQPNKELTVSLEAAQDVSCTSSTLETAKELEDTRALVQSLTMDASDFRNQMASANDRHEKRIRELCEMQSAAEQTWNVERKTLTDQINALTSAGQE